MANEPMRYEIEHPEIQELLRALGEKLGADIPKGWGFALFVFEFDPGDSLFYISNAQRQQFLKTMREFVKKFGEN